MPNFLQKSVDLGNRIGVCPIYEYWIDIGRPETLKEAINIGKIISQYKLYNVKA